MRIDLRRGVAMVTAVAAFVFAAFAGGLFASAANAQPYPNRSIRVVVPYAPGGGVDTIVRLLAPRMGELLGQSLVIENRPGGGTVIATELVVRSKPDGYTMLATGAPIFLNTALGMKLPYDVLTDIEPISLMVILPGVIAVHPSQPYRTIAELVAAARAKPGAISYGSAGIGSIGHLGGELFRARAGIDVVHVGYKGSAPALADLVGGQLPMLVDALVPTGMQAKAGKVRALAVASDKRSSMLPDVPTLAEAGYPDLVFGGTFGLAAPPKTPADVIARFHDAMRRAITEPAAAKQIEEAGFQIVANTPAEYAAYIRAEIAKWTEVVRRNNIKAE